MESNGSRWTGFTTWRCRTVCCITTEDGVFVVRGTLQGAEETLKESHFVRCNHWYLVNLQYVSEIRRNIVIVAGDELEISRRNKTAFLSELTDYMGMGT